MGSSDIKVFISGKESICGECNENLGSKAWIALVENQGVLCLACADMEHLVFLPTGDAALTRRAKKYSTLSAVVLKWSKARKRYERQGLLIEEGALTKAEEECLADSEIRERRREREAEKRAELDIKFIERFSQCVRELYPNCPEHREHEIAEHACLKYSGRIGRSASAKSFDEKAIRLAVLAHIRHRETRYDQLLSESYNRKEARSIVSKDIEAILNSWEP